ncbi:hypothetical protein BU26DRAFT_561895 [Trematosphaeria pertusa]|uniref:Uncharacterized protein n=1 Tax=Trematosphaeria pertusa TaxID=390896 RepID=A0A6A6IP02_9PLEO|nr:uncharacterized protein BU26DRAFT_561895 [Trematosphaeria pertusa]KAF2252126.1 hypothetical protein BU26DRAFT_561895 [Trematosphaeria pertusa]
MERRRFLILDYPIPGEEVDKLLGRLTIDFKHPMDASEPADPSSIAKDFLQPPIREKAARILASASQDRNLRIALEPFLGVSNGSNFSTEISLESSLIETHRLRDHNKVFARIMDKYSKDISEMMSYENARFGVAPDKLYMVIGYKCVVDPTKSVRVSHGRTASASAKVPIGAAANAIAPGSLPLGSSLETTSEQRRTGNLNADSQVEGKVVFAVEYKMYKKSRVLSLFRRKKLPWGYMSDRVLSFAPGQAMGEDDDEEESVGSEEHSEDSEEEDAMDKELAEGGYICRLGLDEFYVPHRE